MKNKTEIRFVKSQKKGWVAITKEDRDWNSGISEDELFEMDWPYGMNIKMDDVEQKKDIIKHSIARGI